MRHFHRTTGVTPAEAIESADAFFTKLGMNKVGSTERSRAFTGALGTLKISARAEGGHYTFIEALTDQIGESRLDKNVKKYFVHVHRRADPAHAMPASY